MPGRPRSARDQRRRTYGQNFLADPAVVQRLLARADVRPDDLVVEFGAGRGALTLPLAGTGARVVAVERDPAWARDLRQRLRARGLTDRVRVVEGDLRDVRLPAGPFRVVANPPFALTTALLERLLADPDTALQRADLLLQWDVARKRAANPPTSLRSAAWAPWWSFALGERVPRRAFRPVPAVDGGWLTIQRREPPVLPTWLAPAFREGLRDLWKPPPGPR